LNSYDDRCAATTTAPPARTLPVLVPEAARQPPSDRKRRPRGVRALRPRWSAEWSCATVVCCASSGPASGSTGCSSATAPCPAAGACPAGRQRTA